MSRLVAGKHTRGVVLAGPAGVGKSRLAAEALAIAERAGYTTAEVTATRSASGLPLGAFAPLLSDRHEQTGAVDDKADLLRRAAAALVERGNGRQLALLVDDAHLLDDTSATLVHQLAATKAAFLVATVRTGEPTPDPILALWKDELAVRMAVTGLTERAIGQLLTHVTRGVVDPAAVTEFATRSEGNALFLRELVLGALQTGALERDVGIWRLRGPLSPTDRLVELVESRVAGLDDAEQAFLELVAYGEPLGSAELAALDDAGIAQRLERYGLLSSTMNGRRLELRLAHPMYGDVLRTRMSALRVQSVVRSLASAVEASGARRHEDKLRVALWRLRGGGGQADMLLAGAIEARWRYDFPLAEELAKAAIAAGAGFDARLLAVQLAMLQGRGEEAENDLTALASLEIDDAERCQVALTLIDNLMVLGGHPEHLQLLEEAEKAISDPKWRDQIEARRLALLYHRTNPRVFIDAAEPLIQRASGDAMAWNSLTAGWSYGRLGRTSAALDVIARGKQARASATAPQPWYPWWQDFIEGHVLAWAGRLSEAHILAGRHYRRALADRSIEAQAAFAALLALVAVERGRLHSASRRARESVALHQQLGRAIMMRFGYTRGVLALALRGDTQGADELLTALDTLETPALFFDAGDIIQARAWLAMAQGDIARACQQLEVAVELSERNDPVAEASALHGLVRLGRADDVCDRLSVLAKEMQGPLILVRAAHAVALTEQDAAGLEKVSMDFEALGADLLAAEAAADAAVLRRRAGQRRPAAADQRRAGQLADRCEGAATPALRSIEARVHLTAAEQETALRAAAGASNKAIARDLHLSVRTVENRLQRVYDKLGLAGRSELARALER